MIKNPWFKRTVIFMQPIAFPGWLILLAALAYLVWSFFDIDSRSHSVSDTLINLAFRVLLIGLAYTILAGLSLLLVKKT